MTENEDLQNPLTTASELQGVPKSAAMRLMHELEENRANWNREWSRANALQGKLNRLRESYLATLDTHNRQDFMSSLVDLVGTVEEVLEIPPSGELMSKFTQEM